MSNSREETTYSYSVLTIIDNILNELNIAGSCLSTPALRIQLSVA